MSVDVPGIYILTGGRQVGKSTSCKLLIEHCLAHKIYPPESMCYIPCDELFDPQSFSQILRAVIDQFGKDPFLLVVDEVTYVQDWDRVIKALADEGRFRSGVCLLTGSDTMVLKEAAMRFPGRRGQADQTDFHYYPLSFRQYVDLVAPNKTSLSELDELFKTYLQCGGYLRAINDIAEFGEISEATFSTYEQWIRGDILKRGRSEDTLLSIIAQLFIVGVSQISYSKLTQKVGLVSKDTVIDYCNLLERMDVLFNLQAFDQNTKRGFPRKDRKFHLLDPFIYHTLYRWAKREGYVNDLNLESTLVEASVASHCHQRGKTFYFKGQGEVDVIRLMNRLVYAVEVKWGKQIKSTDLKMIKQFKNSSILCKQPTEGSIEKIDMLPVYQYLYEI